MIRLGLTLVAVAALGAGCGTRGATAPAPDAGADEQGSGPSAPRATSTTTAGPVMSGTDLEAPPPYRLRYDGRELALRPHTWCYESGCLDGFSEDPPSVGSPATIRVRVPVEGWDLSATFAPAGQRCGRRQTVQPLREGDWYVLRPAGPAGSYDVELFAQGEGDMVATFGWATPADGELPEPRGRLAVIAEDDGRADSYGVELMLENLARTPRSAAARITVTAASGRSLTFDANRSGQRCWPAGTVYFDGPDVQGEAAATLGGFPFTYAVTVTLDGATYRASAVYPRDGLADNEPSVGLDFSPALPALRRDAAAGSG